MTVEQGVDKLGCEYKRTNHDFIVKPLAQDNCICNICHGTGAKWAVRYVTRDYASDRQKNRICNTLQAHGHNFWICPACLENFTALTGLKVVRAERGDTP